jgi:riboflavin kinase/FMN adenylyltransferase
VKVVHGNPSPEHLAGRRPVVTIGNFDGVHQGHQALLSHVVRRAEQGSAPAVAMTFHPHPKGVIGRGAPELITTEAQKLELMERAGIDLVFVIPFSPELAALTAAEFIERILWQGTHLRDLVVGHDFRFGKGGEGHYDLLREEGAKLGFGVHQEGATQIAGLVVSSTAVRQALRAGNLGDVNLYLGRDYFIDGEVVGGHRRGRSFGYPTANLKTVNQIIPATGIYATWVTIEGTFYYGATNVGHNPTFGDETLSVETFLLDFDGDLYGKPMRLHFSKRLRDELKFDTIEALKIQIDLDVAAVRKYFLKERVPLERRR